MEPPLGTEGAGLVEARRAEALAVNQIVELGVELAEEIVLLGLSELARLHGVGEVRLDGTLDRGLQAIDRLVLIARDVRRVPWIARLPYWTGGPNTIVWLSAMVLVMPLLVVSFRKLRLAATLLSDIVVDGAEPGVGALFRS